MTRLAEAGQTGGRDLGALAEYAATKAQDAGAPDTITVLGASLTRATNAEHLSPAWYEGRLCGHSVSVWAPLPNEVNASHACALSIGVTYHGYHGHGRNHEEAVRSAIVCALDSLDTLRLTETALRRVSEPPRPRGPWARGDSRSARLSPTNLARFAIAHAAGNAPGVAAAIVRRSGR